jgi:hypothetical protein
LEAELAVEGYLAERVGLEDRERREGAAAQVGKEFEVWLEEEA